MSNADDSPASDDDRGDRTGRDQAAPEENDGADGSDSGGGPNLDLGSGPSSSSEDGSGFSLPDPSSVAQTDDEDDSDDEAPADTPEEFDAGALGDEDTSPDPDDPPTDGDALAAEEPLDTPSSEEPFPDDAPDETEHEDDDEVLELDGDDLIVEEEDAGDRSPTDFSDEAKLIVDDDDDLEEPVDAGPTQISDGIVDDDLASSGLSNLADEIDSADPKDSGSGLDRESSLDGAAPPEDATDETEGYTPGSGSDKESGTVEQAAPAVGRGDGTAEHAAPAVSGADPMTDDDSSSSDTTETPSTDSDSTSPTASASQSDSVSQNPPPPEQTGHGRTDSKPSSDPTAEASLEEEPSGDYTFSDQETELFDSPFEHDPIYPRLNVLEGPSSGQEFLLNKLRNAVGRSTNNTVTVADEAMSRQHIEIIRNADDTYTIRDLQSVNGTYLNGTKIREADLYHGDRLEVGTTTFQFVVPGQRPGNEDERSRYLERAPETDAGAAQKPSKQVSVPTGHRPGDDPIATWLNRIIVGALILLVPLAGTFLYLTVSDPPTEATSANSAQREARNAYLAGVKSVKRREWQSARTHFEKANELAPEVIDVEAQFDRISAEQDARDSLEEAREALAEGNDDRAQRLAESVPRDSVYYEDAREIVRRQRRKRRIASLYDQAETQFDDESYQDALATLQRILNTIPNHADALNLRRRILRKTDADLAAAEEQADEQKAESPKPAPKRRAANRTASSDSDDSWLIDDSGGGGSSNDGDESGGDNSGRVVNFTKGFTLYRQKKFDAAIAHFDDAASRSDGAVGQRADSAASHIRDFRSHYQAGQDAYTSSNWQSAINEYRKARRADQQVAGSGYFGTEIDGKLAKAHANIGLEAFENGDYTGAFDAYQQARQHDDSADPVRELRRKLDKKARSMYIQAAAKRKTDPQKTATMCRTIMAIVPPDSKNYRKAEKLLDEL